MRGTAREPSDTERREIEDELAALPSEALVAYFADLLANADRGRTGPLDGFRSTAAFRDLETRGDGSAAVAPWLERGTPHMQYVAAVYLERRSAEFRVAARETLVRLATTSSGIAGGRARGYLGRLDDASELTGEAEFFAHVERLVRKALASEPAIVEEPGEIRAVRYALGDRVATIFVTAGGPVPAIRVDFSGPHAFPAREITWLNTAKATQVARNIASYLSGSSYFSWTYP